MHKYIIKRLQIKFRKTLMITLMVAAFTLTVTMNILYAQEANKRVDISNTDIAQKFNVNSGITALVPAMTDLRHDLHENPQTGFEETYAHKRITDLLKKWNIPYDVMATTGIVATLEGKQNTSGKVIGLRADMDALNIKETSGVEWASKNERKMHACHHDGHMTMLLTALQYLQERQDFDGTIKFVFQPSEEGLGGALKMLEEGILEKHRMDAFYAVHSWPDLPLGKAAVHTGPVMASNTNYRILLEGKSSHGALPEQGTNSVLVGAKLVTALDDLHQKFETSHPGKKVVISTTGYHGGDFGSMSALPDDVEMAGTIRTYDLDIKNSLPEVITNAANDVAQKHGMTAKVEFPNICSPTVNDKDKALNSKIALSDILGPDNVEWDAKPAMTAEDFGEFTGKVPLSYIWLGNGTPEDPKSPHNRGLHSSGTDFNDRSIPIGAQYFVNLVKLELPINLPNSQPVVPVDN